MTDDQFFMLVNKRRELLDLLNQGVVDDKAWVKFVLELQAAGCDAMAENMARRFMHYYGYEELGERIETWMQG